MKSVTTTGSESGVSFRDTLRSALILPFMPRKGFAVLLQNSKLGGPVLVVVVFSLLYATASSVTGVNSDPASWEFNGVEFTFRLAFAIVYFVLLVIFSTAFVRSAKVARKTYFSNAGIIAFWFAWRLIFYSILVVSHPNREIRLYPFSGSEIIYLVATLSIFVWFVLLLGVALSVANNARFKYCVGIAFEAILFVSVIAGLLYGVTYIFD